MHEHHSASTARTPSRLPTPPPLALDLSHEGRPVGWVRGDTIGFRGFASNAEAAHAAWVAYHALAQRLTKAGGDRPIPVDIQRLTLGHHRDVDLVMAGGQPIATLLRPGPASRSGDSFGFELRVPAPTHETRMRGMAYLVYRTMRKSGVRWALWGRDAAPTASRRGTIAAERTMSARAPRTDPRGGTHDPGWGVALLCVVLFLALALIVPRVAVLPLGAAVFGALALVGALEWPRRWWARRARGAERLAPRITAADGSTTRRAATVEPATRRAARRWASAITAVVTASVAGLLLALVLPERLALPLSVAGFIGLFAGRLLMPRTGWSTTRPIRPATPARETRTERDRAPTPAVASGATD